jgi:outer membrane protein TolC
MKLQAIATGLPTIDLMGSWNRSRDPSFALDETFGGSGEESTIPAPYDTIFGGFIPAPDEIPPQTFWRASLNASWELRPYRVYSAVRAAGSRLSQQRSAVTGAEHETVESVVHAYYDVVGAAERLAALLAEVDSRREFLDISRRRLLVEFATPLDTLQAAVSLANLDPQVRRARQEVRNSGARLNVLMGRATLEPVTVRGAPEAGAEEIDPEWALMRVEERPDIVQLRLQERILRRTASVQRATNHPYLNVDASYGYVGKTLDTINDKGHDFWSARVALTLPLFDGFLTRGQVQETKAAIRRTGRELEEAVRRARLEILTLLGDLDAARRNLEAAALNLERAGEALSRMQQRYEVGKAEYLEVLNAQAERFTARSEEIAARIEVLKLTASLKRALGISPLETLTGA